jgi:hypothetical protein
MFNLRQANRLRNGRLASPRPFIPSHSSTLALAGRALTRRNVASRPLAPSRPSILRPEQQRVTQWQRRAGEATVTGDEQSGHIAAATNESILFFDSMCSMPVTRVPISEC